MIGKGSGLGKANPVALGEFICYESRSHRDRGEKEVEVLHVAHKVAQTPGDRMDLLVGLLWRYCTLITPRRGPTSILRCARVWMAASGSV